MDFNLTQEQVMFGDAVRGFARQNLAAGALARAHEPGFPFDVAAMLSEQGLLGITLKESDGGQGGTLMDAVLAIEAVAESCPRSTDVIQAGNFGPIRTFAEYATLEQKARFLPDLLAGRNAISLGMSESEAGSAATDLRTTARLEGEHYVVNGSKVFGTHSAEATLYLIYVRFGPGIDGIGSLLIERDTPGFTVGATSRFANGEDWAPLFFEDCRVPAANLLLGPGGFKRQIAAFNAERIGNTARSLAVGRYAFERAREYAVTRRQFGRALVEFQGLQWKFAEMALKLESAQLLLYRAAVNADEGLPSAYETTLAKLACNQAGFDIANEAIQIMGGSGFSDGSLVEYCQRRCRGWMIAGGSIEMMKNRLAEEVFERRFSQRPDKPTKSAVA